jgi:transcriptional regulator with XRE-family HTH domain
MANSRRQARQRQRALVGRNIERAREAVLATSQTQLAAELAKRGSKIDRTALSAYENGRKRPEPESLDAIAAALSAIAKRRGVPTPYDHDTGWFYVEHGADGE